MKVFSNKLAYNMKVLRNSITASQQKLHAAHARMWHSIALKSARGRNGCKCLDHLDAHFIIITISLCLVHWVLW